MPGKNFETLLAEKKLIGGEFGDYAPVIVELLATEPRLFNGLRSIVETAFISPDLNTSADMLLLNYPDDQALRDKLMNTMKTIQSTVGRDRNLLNRDDRQDKIGRVIRYLTNVVDESKRGK